MDPTPGRHPPLLGTGDEPSKIRGLEVQQADSLLICGVHGVVLP